MKIKKDEIRNRILTAAETQFYNNGFFNTTTRSLANAADVTYGNMYKYFPNKEEILKALMGSYAKTVYEGFSNHLEHNKKEEFMPENIMGISNGFISLYKLSRIKFLIFFTGLRGSDMDQIRKKVMKLLASHINKTVKNQILAEILTENLISAVIRLAGEYEDVSSFGESLKKYIRYHMSGIRELQ